MNRMNRWRANIMIGVLGTVLSGGVVFHLHAVPPKNAFESRTSVPNPQMDRSMRPSLDDTESDAKRKRQREGTTLIDVTGTFRERNERHLFRQGDTGREYRVLENLALERVSRALGNHTENRLWIVSGTLTEYHGENFLIITRAMLKSQTNTPTAGRAD